MTIDEKRSRLQELRDLPHPRNAASEAELATLIAELQAYESGNLSAATQRMKQEREAIEARMRSLESVAARRAGLLARLNDTLAEARAERQAIDGELSTLLARMPGAGSA